MSASCGEKTGGLPSARTTAPESLWVRRRCFVEPTSQPAFETCGANAITIPSLLVFYQHDGLIDRRVPDVPGGDEVIQSVHGLRDVSLGAKQTHGETHLSGVIALIDIWMCDVPNIDSGSE